jgi:serine/threonine protein phosphatase 1
MANSVTFAIGDVHGCFGKLESLITILNLLSEAEYARFVFIGDYVDRGPNTREVIDFLIESQRREKRRFICLRGNHETMLLNATIKKRSERDLMNWLANGGEQTLDSYGVNDPRALPTDHLAWMKALPLKYYDQKRLYVHAGVRPGVSIMDQSEEDLLWIREPFLSSDNDHGAFVVHGHTPTESGLPDLRSNRLNIDTGACFGGQLTAAIFTSAQLIPSLFCNDTGDFWQP